MGTIFNGLGLEHYKNYKKKLKIKELKNSKKILKTKKTSFWLHF